MSDKEKRETNLQDYLTGDGDFAKRGSLSGGAPPVVPVSEAVPEVPQGLGGPAPVSEAPPSDK